MSHFIFPFIFSLVASKYYVFGEMSQYKTLLFKCLFFFPKSTSSWFYFDIHIGSSELLLEVVVKVSMISANDLSVTFQSFLHGFQEL